jgi:DNA-binding CsgD family transcriptional regulator
MVIAGQSNTAIGDRLGVSKRAIEYHLTKAYRKLGVQGRSQLLIAFSCSSKRR